MLTKKGEKKIIRNAKNFDTITSLKYMWMCAHCHIRTLNILIVGFDIFCPSKNTIGVFINGHCYK